jgi:hypothetical protein
MLTPGRIDKTPEGRIRVLPYQERGGEIILFSDYEPLPEYKIGHPQGAGWFYPQHAKEAKLCQGMTLDQAVEALCTKLQRMVRP